MCASYQGPPSGSQPGPEYDPWDPSQPGYDQQDEYQAERGGEFDWPEGWFRPVPPAGRPAKPRGGWRRRRTDPGPRRRSSRYGAGTSGGSPPPFSGDSARPFSGGSARPFSGGEPPARPAGDGRFRAGPGWPSPAAAPPGGLASPSGSVPPPAAPPAMPPGAGGRSAPRHRALRPEPETARRPTVSPPPGRRVGRPEPDTVRRPTLPPPPSGGPAGFDAGRFRGGGFPPDGGYPGDRQPPGTAGGYPAGDEQRVGRSRSRPEPGRHGVSRVYGRPRDGRGGRGAGDGRQRGPELDGGAIGATGVAAGFEPIGVNTDYDTAQFPAITTGTIAAPGRAAGASLVRSSGVMAIGTLASRLTGLLRTLIQAAALGAATLSIAYNNGNTLPNVVYNIVLGGILTSVIVPLLVSAAARRRGEAYDQRTFTLLTIGLLGITVVATLAAGPIVSLYLGHYGAATVHLTVLFAYFFIPQVFFYGVSSLVGAVLNARGSFAAPMWTPVVNNVVVIAVLAMFMVVARSNPRPSTMSSAQVVLLGAGTTLGIVAQTVALIPALRRVGFRWRPRFDFRRDEFGEIWRLAAWILAYVAFTQIAFLVTTRIANLAGETAHVGYGANFTAYTYAWQLFQMPYAVVGISVITALLPRMSQHAAEGKLSLVRDDFSTGVRLSSVIVVPSALVLAALGPALGVFLLAHGHTSVASGRYEGDVFAVFCLGLLPYMYFQLQLRVFYSLHDSRTPALVGLATMVVNIVTNLIALAVLPRAAVVAGLGIGFGLANAVGTLLAGRILNRRLGGMDGWYIRRSLVRMHAAAVPATVFALVVAVALDSGARAGHLAAAAAVILGGAGAVAIYVFSCRLFRVGELSDLARTVTARFRR